MKTTREYVRLLRGYKRAHAAGYGVERMGIFGSVARREQRKDAGVDAYFESPPMSLFKNGRVDVRSRRFTRSARCKRW